MRNKVIDIADAIRLVEPGSSVALGGATLRRKPMALARALAGSATGDLDLWTWIGSLDVDLLIGAQLVRRVNSAYVGFGAFGLAQATRRAFAQGTVEFRDWSESSLVASFRAGASGLPIALTRALLGTSMAVDVAREIVSPFGGPPILAVPAARPDIALLHAQSADEFGNIRRRGPNVTDDIDHVIAAASRQVIVSVERIDSHQSIVAHRDETVIPGHYVTAICVAPRGAHPTGCDGYYDPDGSHLAAYARASADPELLQSYLRDFVHGVASDEYLRRVDADGDEAA
jgi:glutaconate CoA-transferase subunit A